MSQVVTAFSKPGDLVGLLRWPSKGGEHRCLEPVAADRAIGDAASTEVAVEVASAVSVTEELKRTGRVLSIASDPATLAPGAGRARVVLDEVRDRVAGLQTGADDWESPGGAGADLIVTSMAPTDADGLVCDRVAQSVTRLLRAGGTFVVLTHCDWSRGRLVDPTGAMVASAQNADLLYLQHIIPLQAPVRGGVIAPALSHSAATGFSRSPAGCRPHRRIHSDLLVFIQPHDHEPPQPPPDQSMDETADEIGGRP